MATTAAARSAHSVNHHLAGHSQTSNYNPNIHSDQSAGGSHDKRNTIAIFSSQSVNFGAPSRLIASMLDPRPDLGAVAASIC
jgi:hypothetical protein